MGWPQFLAWAATQGFKHTKFLRQAYNSFKGKLPGKDVILKTARNFYDKAIAKVPTKKIADKIRQDIKKDKLPIPKEFNKFVPEIVSKTKITPKVVTPKSKKPGFHPSVIKGGKKADGGRIDKALPTRSRDI